jgi:hypothetical protein
MLRHFRVYPLIEFNGFGRFASCLGQCGGSQQYLGRLVGVSRFLQNSQFLRQLNEPVGF